MSERNRMSGGERRKAIMEAAVLLFAERGFRGTTTRALAAAVGVTEPVLYAHFKSKRDLFRAIIATRAQEGLDQAEALVRPDMERNDDRAVLTRLAAFILDKHLSDPVYSRLLLFIALEGRDLGRLFYERQIVAARKLVAGYIRRRVRDRVFRQLDPDLAARIFLSMVVNRGILAVLFHETMGPALRTELVKAIVDVFLWGVSAQNGVVT